MNTKFIQVVIYTQQGVNYHYHVTFMISIVNCLINMRCELHRFLDNPH